MNAYELADDVKNISNTIEALEWVQKASPLLRQQADRIAELEKLVSDMVYEKSSGVYDRPQTKHEPVAWVSAYQLAKYWENEAVVMSKTTANMLRQQADRIAELEKGGEIAGRFYWENVVDGHVMAIPSEGTPHYNKDDFPLYTTPQIKELSDEEIDEVLYSMDWAHDPVKFARAILKKASEK